MNKIILTLLVLFGLLTASLAVADNKDNQLTLTVDNAVTLNEVVTTSSVSAVIQQVKLLDARLPSGDPIYLVLDTPGGSISAGLELIENLRNMNRPIHTLALSAYSMGFETVQGLQKRYITRDGTLMSHKGWGMMYGEFPGQFDSRYGWVLKRSKRLVERAVARTNGKHTAKSYAALIENEFWCDGKDCIKEGFADAVVTATCDKSLAGVKLVTYDRWLEATPGGIVVIEIKLKRSECPLNTGYLGWDIYIDGKPLFGALEEKKDVEKFDNEEESFNYETGTIKVENVIPTYQLLEIKNKAEQLLNLTKTKKAIVLP